MTEEIKKKKKATRSSFTLCFLDKKTKLVASEHSFVIKEKVKVKDGEATWIGKFFYSEIADAIRGYARHHLRRPELAAKLDGSIETLIKVLEELDAHINTIADKVKETMTKAEPVAKEEK